MGKTKIFSEGGLLRFSPKSPGTFPMRSSSTFAEALCVASMSRGRKSPREIFWKNHFHQNIQKWVSNESARQPRHNGGKCFEKFPMGKKLWGKQKFCSEGGLLRFSPKSPETLPMGRSSTFAEALCVASTSKGQPRFAFRNPIGTRIKIVKNFIFKKTP